MNFAIKSTAFPERIVCLSDEASELLYLLGEQDRIVGVSGFSTRPPEIRSKPKISSFQDADFEAIERLQPDLILAYSDVQSQIMREAIARGFAVLNFNQRSLTEIFNFIATIARIVGRQERGAQLIASYQKLLEKIMRSAERFSLRPRVYFEEWNDPLISGIEWVEELIALAGGISIFPELRGRPRAQDRIVTPDQIIECNPDVMIASWCGMKADKKAIAARPGWDRIDAVRNGHIYEVRSSCILQPGPACLTEGVRQLHWILSHVAGVGVSAELSPQEPVDAGL